METLLPGYKEKDWASWDMKNEDFDASELFP